MTVNVFYEWDIETVDLETGPLHGDRTDIIDHEFFDKCPGIPEDPAQRLVLVRNHYYQFKSWAYVENGRLPEWLTDAHGHPIAKVPKRFCEELAKAAT